MFVRSVSAATSVSTGAGDDAIRVSSNAGADDDGNLDGIRAPLTIDAGGGTANTLVVSDSGGAADQAVVVTNNGITGLAPAAVVLHEAHREVEFLTLSKNALRFKTLVSQEYADLIYNGLWFSALHQDLMAFVVSNQQYVSGTARVKLYKGHAMIVGRKSEHSLYRHELATYDEGDQYDASAALGFIKIAPQRL